MTEKFEKRQWYSQLKRLFAQKVPALFEGHPFHEAVSGGLDERNTLYIELLAREGVVCQGNSVVDIGAGLSALGPMLRALGLRVTLVDDFGGGGGVELGGDHALGRVLGRFRDFGLTVIEQDLLSSPLPISDASVDAVVSFHSLEHWHHSPRPLFSEVTRILKPGGALIIGCPNVANLRKRLWLLAGKTNLSSLHEWYVDGEPEFRGHVREPTVKELRKLLEWNGFAVQRVVGRNFLGEDSKALGSAPPFDQAPRYLLRVIDPFLRLRPSLCTDIHVVARLKST